MGKIWIGMAGLFVVSGCAAEAGHAVPPSTERAGGEQAASQAELTIDSAWADGFTASATIDLERIEVSYTRSEGAEEIVVRGDAQYAHWVVDREAQWVSGEVGGVSLEESDPAVWQETWSTRPGRVLEGLAVAANEHLAAGGERESTEAQGLSLLAEMLTLVAHRTTEPSDQPPEGAISDGPEGTVTAASSSCRTHSYVCGTLTTVGCWYLGGWGGLACGLAGVVYCGEICSPNSTATYWAGNCNYFCQEFYGCRLNYCVGGGGCSTCY